MALVKYGGGIIQMSGSIAGSTFARNRFGNYARAKTKPVNPNSCGHSLLGVDDSVSQAHVRAALAMLTARWSQVVTSAQRTAWNLYAASVSMKNRLGEAVNLTGFNHYIRSNAACAAAGYTLVDAGPTVFELPEKDPSIIVVPAAGTQACALTFDDTMEWVDEDGAALLIWQGRPQNPQRNYFGGPWIGMKDKGGSSASPKTSPESFSALCTFAEGQKIWYKFRIIRADHRLSEPFFANGIATA